MIAQKEAHMMETDLTLFVRRRARLASTLGVNLKRKSLSDEVLRAFRKVYAMEPKNPIGRGFTERQRPHADALIAILNTEHVNARCFRNRLQSARRSIDGATKKLEVKR
jgi:hypothetical protein